MNTAGEPTDIIVFYSKFSNSCRELDKFIKKFNMTGIDYVCTDNHIIRRKLKRDRNLRIRQVPCVLIVYDSKAVKHEGAECFNWFKHLIEKVLPKEEAKAQQPQKHVDEWANPEPDLDHVPGFMKPRKAAHHEEPIDDDISNYDYEAEFEESSPDYEEEIIGDAGGRGRPVGVDRGQKRRASDAAAKMAAERESIIEAEEPGSRYN
jgi:hypothetical protein